MKGAVRLQDGLPLALCHSIWVAYTRITTNSVSDPISSVPRGVPSQLIV